MANTKVNATQAIQKAIEIWNYGNNNTAYDQGKRLQHGPGYTTQYYDCSSFVGTCWGYTSPPGTANMQSRYHGQDGFDLFEWGTTSLQPGDIIVWRFTAEYTAHLNGTGGHTMLYLGGSPYPAYAIHCTSSGRGGKGGVQSKGSVSPNFSIVQRAFILRGSGGIYITKIEALSDQNNQNSWYTIYPV